MKRILFLATLIFSSTWSLFLFSQTETITLTTYYPSPEGVYQNLLVTERQAIGDVNGDTNVDINDLAVDTVGNPVIGTLTVANNIGIGTTIPLTPLHIAGQGPALTVEGTVNPTNQWYSELRLIDDTNNRLWAISHRRDNPNALSIGYDNGGGWNNYVIIQPDGDVGIGIDPTERLDVNGNLRVRGDLIVDGNFSFTSLTVDTIDINNRLNLHGEMFYDNPPAVGSCPAGVVRWGGTGGTCDGSTRLGVASSLRYKKNINDLIFNRTSFLSLNPRSFQWKKDSSKSVGFIAEEADKIFPQIVIYDKESRPEGINYADLAIYSYAIIQEQQKEIQQLRKEIDQLKEKLQ